MWFTAALLRPLTNNGPSYGHKYKLVSVLGEEHFGWMSVTRKARCVRRRPNVSFYWFSPLLFEDATGEITVFSSGRFRDLIDY